MIRSSFAASSRCLRPLIALNRPIICSNLYRTPHFTPFLQRPFSSSESQKPSNTTPPTVPAAVSPSFEPVSQGSSQKSGTKTLTSGALSSFDYLGLLVFGGLAVMLFQLGQWQLDRSEWKRKMIAIRSRNMDADPQPFELIIKEYEEPLFRRVTVKGRLDYDHQTIIGPRSPPFEVLQNHTGHSGYYLVTPCILESGLRVLINRGWYPSKYDGKSLKEAEKDGVVELEGVIRDAEQASKWLMARPVLQSNRPLTEQWFQTLQFLDSAALYDQLGAALPGGKPLVVDIHSEPPPNEYHLPLRKTDADYTQFTVTPQIHLAYAVTWYSLGLLVLGLTMVRFNVIPWNSLRRSRRR